MSIEGKGTPKLTYAQMWFLDKCASSYPPGGITNQTGNALEKRGLVEWNRRAWLSGHWTLTGEGVRVRDALRGNRERICP